jgi:Uma2 family endonuclease
MAVQERLVTVDEFWEEYAGKPYELVHGRILEVSPTGFSHGATTSRIAALLRQFVDQHQLGEVLGVETGFWLNEHTMRGTDCAYITRDKVELLTEPDKYIPFAPDLAVEVVSPNATAHEIRDKVTLYRAAGTRIVWVIYPSLRKVDVYLPDGSAHEIDDTGTLDGGDMLPGLQIAVADLFPKSSRD